jgi:hypothetical protein
MSGEGAKVSPIVFERQFMSLDFRLVPASTLTTRGYIPSLL